MRVLIACEFTGTVRRAFQARGHYAVSVDLLPAEDGETYSVERGGHWQGCISDYVTKRGTPLFDLLIGHPPCTHLATSGARWFKDKQEVQGFAVTFAWWLLEGPFLNIKRRAIENPVGILSTRLRKPDQIIQPWQFGHGETKATCLWLNSLPPLTSTNIVDGREPRIHHMAPSEDRWKERSRTYQGIAEAMADQWGSLP